MIVEIILSTVLIISWNFMVYYTGYEKGRADAIDDMIKARIKRK